MYCVPYFQAFGTGYAMNFIRLARQLLISNLILRFQNENQPTK